MDRGPRSERLRLQFVTFRAGAHEDLIVYSRLRSNPG
jgi:hypothetical protein